MRIFCLYLNLTLIYLSLLTCNAQAPTSADSLLLKITDEPTEANYSHAFTIYKAYQKDGNHALALTFLKKALNIGTQLNDDSKIAESNEALGDLYVDVRDYKNAVQYYLKAKSYHEKFRDAETINPLSFKIAKMYLRIGKEENAIKIFHKLLTKLDAGNANHLSDLEQVYYFLGIAYGNGENIDSSLYCFRTAQQLLKQIKPENKLKIAGLYNNIGALQSKADNNRLALENYNDALAYFAEIGSIQGKGVTFGNIAYIHQKEGNFNTALKFYDSTVYYLKEQNEDDLFYLVSVYMNMSTLYEKNGNTDSAFSYYKKYVQLNDSLSNIETIQKVTELEKKFELEKKDRELIALEKENENKKEQQTILILLIILLIIVLVLVFYTMRTVVSKVKLRHLMLSNDKDRLEKELKFKNKEVEDFALRIIEKNNFLEQLNEDVKGIKLDGANAQKIKELTSNIKNNLYINRDRRNLEDRLDDIHKTFIHRLEEKIPNLTKSEKRLCTLLIMEMSSKDMASILNISLQGVKTARHRLRKKLNLSQDEDLTQYLKGM